MAIENIQCARYSLASRSYYWAHHFWVQRKTFKEKALRMLENTFLRLVFANTVFQKRAILLIF